MSSKKSMTIEDIREIAGDYLNLTKKDFFELVISPYLLDFEIHPLPEEVKKQLSPEYITNKILNSGSEIMFEKMTPEKLAIFMENNKDLTLDAILPQIDSYLGPYLGKEIMEKLQEYEKEYEKLHKKDKYNAEEYYKRSAVATSSVPMFAKLGIEVEGPNFNWAMNLLKYIYISDKRTSNSPEEFVALRLGLDKKPIIDALLIKSSNVIFSNELDIENIDIRRLRDEDCCVIAEYVFQHKIQENMIPRSKNMSPEKQEERLLSIDNRTLEIVRPFREWSLDKRIENIATMKRGLEIMEKRAEREHSRA